MGLTDPTALVSIDTSNVTQLTAADLDDLNQLFAASYPGNWFDSRMLETGCYYGLRHDDQLISVAGIHVFSPTFKVATLGNVTTHPDFRRQGLGKRVCAKLCQALINDNIDAIGLNVFAENSAAIRVYESLGFEKMGDYGEYMMTLKG
jgi:predicted GNAT family acetyltransferase